MAEEETIPKRRFVEICLSGHVKKVFDAYYLKEKEVDEFCARCGKRIISLCQNPECPHPRIQGSYPTFLHQVTHLSLLHPTFIPDHYCRGCGAIHPWTQMKLDDARKIIDGLETLDPDEKGILNQSIADLVQDTPRRAVALTNFNRLMKKAGPVAREALKTTLIELIPEAFKILLQLPP